MELNWQWIWALHAQCVQPDMTIFIDVPVDVCLKRITVGRGSQVDLFESKLTLERAREGYLSAIDRLCKQGETIEIIDGDASFDQVHRDIRAKVELLIRS
jgi:thymidylate kinase